MVDEPLIFRTTAQHFVDLIINHPDVRPTVQKGCDRLSSVDVLSDYRNICYGGEGGVAIFIWKGEGVYEGHVFLVPGCRGACGLAFGKAALRALFASGACCKVVAEVPWELPAARWYVRRLGFVSRGRDTEQPVELFQMEAYSERIQ